MIKMSLDIKEIFGYNINMKMLFYMKAINNFIFSLNTKNHNN